MNGSGFTLAAIRVLIVDDVVELADAFASALEEHGVEIVGKANNGAEAVSMTKALKPNVVLMDVRMPVMDGIRATRAISRSGGDAKVLMLTAFEDSSLIDEAMEAGAVGYLVKGTLSTDTVRAIEAVMQRARGTVA